MANPRASKHTQERFRTNFYHRDKSLDIASSWQVSPQNLDAIESSPLHFKGFFQFPDDLHRPHKDLFRFTSSQFRFCDLVEVRSPCCILTQRGRPKRILRVLGIERDRFDSGGRDAPRVPLLLQTIMGNHALAMPR